jgi:hypothetical protein
MKTEVKENIPTSTKYSPKHFLDKSYIRVFLGSCNHTLRLEPIRSDANIAYLSQVRVSATLLLTTVGNYDPLFGVVMQ